MKRCIAALLCLCVMLSLCACTSEEPVKIKGNGQAAIEDLIRDDMSVEDARKLEDFERVQKTYMQVCELYEAILELDNRTTAGTGDPLLMAPEYEVMLSDIDELVVQIMALKLNDSQYNQLRSMLQVWVGTDAAVYCQKMSAAISRNDAAAAADALVLRNAMYNDFMTGMTYEEFDAQFGGIVSQLGAEKKENALIELLRLKESLDKAKKIIEDCDVDVEEKKVVTGTEDVKAINVVYSMSTKELKALTDIASEWFGGNYEAIFEELTGQLPEEAGVDAYAAEILAAVNSVKAALDETKANVKLTFSINPSSGLIMKVECVLETTVEEEKEYITVNVDFGKDLRKSSEYQINFITSSGIESAASKVTIGYQIKDSEGMYHRRLYCKVLGDEVDKTIEFVLKWNTKSEVFTAEFDSVDTNVVISGGAGVKSGNLWLTIDKVTVNREATEVGLKLEFDPGANTPKMPKYTNIADLSASDWEEITSMLGAAQVN